MPDHRDMSAPRVRWGLIDAALSAVAPRTAARRYAARVAISNLRRDYDAAGRGRGTAGWSSRGTAADAEIAADGPLLRHRMRDLVRNNPMAAQAVQVLVNNIVGTGIRPRAATGDAALNRQVDALWRRWASGCDQHGHTDFHGVLGLAVREMIEGGDVFAIRRTVKATGPRDVPLRIELREADHLDAARFDSRADGSRISQGIEYDRNGRRAAYWMFSDHPGDTSPVFSRRLDSTRLPADRVAHLFERQRVQSRGVPWGTPAMRAIRDLDDWQQAELVRKRTEACLVGIVFGADEDQQSIAPVVEDAAGNRIEQFEPGLIAYARGGKDIKFNHLYRRAADRRSRRASGTGRQPQCPHRPDRADLRAGRRPHHHTLVLNSRKIPKMSETTAHLALPFLIAAQAQKHVTHNEALRILDAMVQLSAATRAAAAPPASPAEGARYIVAAGASGVWTGWTDSVACWLDGAWLRFPPQPGWLAWVEDEAQVLVWTGATWGPMVDAMGFIARGASVAVAKGGNGATTGMAVIEETLTGLSGASRDSTVTIPDRAIVLGVSSRTVTAITGATSYDCGIAGEASKFGGSLGIAAGNTNRGVIGPQAFYADTPIRLTARGGNFTSGAVRIAIHLLTVGLPS